MGWKTLRSTFKRKPFMDGSGRHADAERPYGATQHADDLGLILRRGQSIREKVGGVAQKTAHHTILKYVVYRVRSARPLAIGTKRTTQRHPRLSDLGSKQRTSMSVRP